MNNALNITTGATFATMVVKLVSFMNDLVPVLATAAIVFFFYGLVRFIRNSGDAKGRATGRDAIVWGLVGIFVIFALWGIIRFIQISLSLPTSPAQNQKGFPNDTPYPRNQGTFPVPADSKTYPQTLLVSPKQLATLKE